MNKNVARVAVKLYTAREVKEIKTCADPKVMGTWALRATMEDDDTLDFLVVGYRRTMGSGELSRMLEECEFETFPPQAGKLKFFV